MNEKPTKGRRPRKKVARPAGYYQAIGAKGGRANVEKHGAERMRQIGAIGGRSQKPRPRAYYINMNRLSQAARARKRLLADHAQRQAREGARE